MSESPHLCSLKVNSAMPEHLDTEELIEASRHLWQNYFPGKQPAKHPGVLVRGEGLYVYDADGNRYLDTFASLLTTLCGHGRPEVVKAVKDQMEKLSYFPGGQNFIMEPTVRLAKVLAEITPGDLSVTFFVNDGSEACEAAIKMARQYFWTKGEKTRQKIIFRRYSYHGATLGALSATGLPAMREPFEPLLPGFTHVMPAWCYRCELDLQPCFVRCGLSEEPGSYGPVGRSGFCRSHHHGPHPRLEHRLPATPGRLHRGRA